LEPLARSTYFVRSTQTRDLDKVPTKASLRAFCELLCDLGERTDVPVGERPIAAENETAVASVIVHARTYSNARAARQSGAAAVA
jgi:hypothetical protein